MPTEINGRFNHGWRYCHEVLPNGYVQIKGGLRHVQVLHISSYTRGLISYQILTGFIGIEGSSAMKESPNVYAASKPSVHVAAMTL